MTRKKIKGHADLVQVAPGIIENIDQQGFLAYTRSRQKIIDRDKEVEDLKAQVAKLTKLFEAQNK